MRSVGGFFLFVAAGLAAIIVGSFMIRGNMHMWDLDGRGVDGNRGGAGGD